MMIFWTKLTNLEVIESFYGKVIEYLAKANSNIQQNTKGISLIMDGLTTANTNLVEHTTHRSLMNENIALLTDLIV